MNDEIKGILEYLKKSTNSKDFCGMMITKNNLDKILDYITNLQEENEDYKSKNEKAIDFVKKESKKCYSNRTTDNPTKVIGNFMWHTDKLLNILNGGD